MRRFREKLSAATAVCLLALLTACGSPGAPQPPSLDLPNPVQDLTAARKGDRVFLAWTVPQQNTDKTNIRRIGPTRICRDLRVTSTQCREVGRVATAVLLQAAPPRNAGNPPPVRASYQDTIPPALISDNPLGHVTYAVETLNRRGKSAGLSNQVRVPLAPTLPAPENLRGGLSAAGVQLSWTGSSPPQHERISYRYRVYRQDQSPPQNRKTAVNPQVVIAEIPISPEPAFLDKTIEWEKPYVYHVTTVTSVQQVHGPDQQVEGADSTPLHIFTRDIFAPAVPTGLQAVFSGVGQQPFVDLTWAPDLDADLAGYNVYRWEQGGTPVRLNAQLVPSPSFRDTNVAAGRTYYYSVSAVDLRGNESARSEQTAEQIP